MPQSPLPSFRKTTLSRSIRRIGLLPTTFLSGKTPKSKATRVTNRDESLTQFDKTTAELDLRKAYQARRVLALDSRLSPESNHRRSKSRRPIAAAPKAGK